VCRFALVDVENAECVGVVAFARSAFSRPRPHQRSPSARREPRAPQRPGLPMAG